MPDNIRILRQLKSDGLLYTTPKGDYDDSYCIQYARENSGVIVSNDRYRNAIYKKWRCPLCGVTNGKNDKTCKERDCEGKNKVTKEEWQWRRKLMGWLRTHVITYMFVNDEFIPNPDYRP
eukprot:TRINITY_DN4003_c0_g1_i1.p1 TRINITY_DN4003_c0_g1~~TRINITY_DN4003_c0_g1_i1.p1  ORF type:complete len:120 (+),score=29.40 TRINITY_DN4003_c0_g1_i1:343-702(+)